MLEVTIQLVNATKERVYKEIVVATPNNAITSQKAQNLFLRIPYAVTRLSAPVKPMWGGKLAKGNRNISKTPTAP